MKKRKNNIDEELLFQTIDDDPRLADTVSVDETIDSDVNELFKVVGTSDEKIEKLDSTPYSYWSLAFKHLFKNPFVFVCLAILVVLIVFTIIGPILKYYPPLKMEGGIYIKDDANHWNTIIGPNADHWFGEIGRAHV